MHLYDELWFPPLRSLQWGLRYEFNNRDSSVNEDFGTSNYGYREHRILLSIDGTKQWNPSAPSINNTPRHVPLNYGIQKEHAGKMEVDRDEISEMLRADEAASAASSCVE